VQPKIEESRSRRATIDRTNRWREVTASQSRNEIARKSGVNFKGFVDTAAALNLGYEMKKRIFPLRQPSRQPVARALSL
jgi:hypothetical protein